MSKPKSSPRYRQVLVDEEVHKLLGHLSVDEGRPVKDLVQEAVIKQYGFEVTKSSRLVPLQSSR